jgi:hypothetical protein
MAVIGTLNILTHPGKVLFDTGATTSFISKDFVGTPQTSLRNH